MKKIFAFAVLAAMMLSCFCMVASAEATTATAETETSAPIATAIYGDCLIDGELDDTWKFAQINYVTNVFTDNELNGDPAQARFRVMYDDKYLYFYVEVYDISMSSLEHEMGSGNSWYNRDGVGFVFSPDGNKDETPGTTAPAFWYIIRAFSSAANYNQVSQDIFVTEKEGATINEQNDFEKVTLEERMYCCKQLKDASGAYTGYVIECKVNLLARLDDCKTEGATVATAMTAGMEIGFDMYINDCNYLLISNSRDYGLCWSDVSSYKNNATKGTIVLADKTVSFNDAQDGFPKTVVETTEEEITTKAPDEATTAPVDTTAAPEEDTTEAPVETTATETAAPAEETTAAAKTEEKGCGSSVMAFAVLAVIGTAFVVKKH